MIATSFPPKQQPQHSLAGVPLGFFISDIIGHHDCVYHSRVIENEKVFDDMRAQKSLGLVFAISVCGMTALQLSLGVAVEAGFPFGEELQLDTQPLPDSKRVPTIEIENDASAVLDLWCVTARSQAIVVNDTITVLPGPLTDQRECDDERQHLDDEIIAALREVTNWRWNDDVVELIGPRTLSFRLPTH